MVRHLSARIIVTLALVCTSGVLSPISRAVQPPEVAILYPVLEEPYRGVLASIIEGVQADSKIATKLFPLDDGYDANRLSNAITSGHFSAIIALGRTGLTAAEKWRGKIPIVVGALLLSPEVGKRGLAGISLAADPERLLAHLKVLDPAVKRVHVVYSADSSEWLVKIALGIGKKLNLRLYSHESKDIRSSALIYRDIIDKAQPGEDAIWLLPDPVAADGRIILPLLLREAWNKEILLFSSNPSQVKRGVLFALFPDNKSMGASLAKKAESYFGVDPDDIENDIEPLRDLQSAINIRTADHMGLTITNEERKGYELVFPTP